MFRIFDGPQNLWPNFKYNFLFKTINCFSAFYNDSCFLQVAFFTPKLYFFILSTSRTVLPKPSQLNSKVENLECEISISNLSHLRDVSAPTYTASEQNDIQDIISVNCVKLKIRLVRLLLICR